MLTNDLKIEGYDPLSSMKNKDADAHNPNLYQYEDDDNKLDHVYDEIKHKEGYGNYFKFSRVFCNAVNYVNTRSRELPSMP